MAFMLPFVGYAAFTAVTLYADRWIIQIFAGAAAVGMYAALFQIASSPVNLLFAVINQLMVPIIMNVQAPCLKKTRNAKPDN